MKKLVTCLFSYCLLVGSTQAMKKEIEIKFTLEQEAYQKFYAWLDENAERQGVEEHEEVYLNNPHKSFFFDHAQGFKDAHTTMRLRKKKITHVDEIKYNESFCSKVCHVDEHNRTVSRDEFEVDLSLQDAKETLINWLEKQPFLSPQKGCSWEQVHRLSKVSLTSFFIAQSFTDLYELKKERTLYRYNDFEIALDIVDGIGSFIEVELKSDEQDVKKGTKQIHDFLQTTGTTEFTQYDRSYLHMKVNPGYNFGQQLSIALAHSD